MPLARRPGRDRRRHRHLVAASNAPLDARAVGLHEDDVDGWRVGLYATERLAAHFPAFYARYVAPQRITTARMLGVTHAFLELAHRELLTLDLSYFCPIKILDEEDDVAEVVDGYIDHGGILSTLDLELRGWLLQPPLQVYGLGRELSTGCDGPGLLALILWSMGAVTSWSVAPYADILKIFPPRSRWRKIVREVALLPDALDMRHLCDACAWSCVLPGIDGPWRLGEVVRFVFGQVHNSFADMSSAELHDNDWGMMGVELWEGIWSSPHLAAECAWQRGARRLRQVYDALSAAVEANTQLLQELIGTLLRDAQAILAVMAPASLLFSLAEADTPSAELLERGYALLAGEVV